MYRVLLLRLALWSVVSLGVGSPGPALAQTKPPAQAAASAQGGADPLSQQVRTLIREAGALMDRGDRAGAVNKLLQARRLRPDPSLDYNLGIAYADWGKHPEAAAALTRFLAVTSRDAVTRDRIQEAERRLRVYQAELARLTILLAPQAPTPASVLIDSQNVGQAPLTGHFLVPGAHDLRVTAPGARDYQVSLSIQAGEERTLTADPLPLAAAPSGAGLVPLSTTAAAPPPPTPIYKRWWVWTAAGAGAILAAGLIGAAAAGRFNRPAGGMDLPVIEVSP